MPSSWREFALAFLAVSLVFGSVAGFVAVREYDNHCKYEEKLSEPGGGNVVAYYDQFSPAQRDLFHRLLDARGKTITHDQCDVFDSPRGMNTAVRYQGQYYEVGYWRTFDWSEPPMLAVAGTFLVGAALLYGLARSRLRRKPW